MSEPRIDKHLKSIRGLPKGDFQTYRQIFNTQIKYHFEKQDILNGVKQRLKSKKVSESILQLPYTDDEKTTHLRLTPMSTPLNKSFGDENTTEPEADTCVRENKTVLADTCFDYENQDLDKRHDSPKYEMLCDVHSGPIGSLVKTNDADSNKTDKEVKTSENLLEMKELSSSLNSVLRFVQIDDIELSDESFENENFILKSSYEPLTNMISISNACSKDSYTPASPESIPDTESFSQSGACTFISVPQPVPALISPPSDSPKITTRLNLVTDDIYTKLKEFQNELNLSFNINTPDEFRIEAPVDCPVLLNDHIYETVGSTAAIDRRKINFDESLKMQHQDLSEKQSSSLKSNSKHEVAKKHVSEILVVVVVVVVVVEPRYNKD
jgi:hypothetical protein